MEDKKRLNKIKPKNQIKKFMEQPKINEFLTKEFQEFNVREGTVNVREGHFFDAVTQEWVKFTSFVDFIFVGSGLGFVDIENDTQVPGNNGLEVINFLNNIDSGLRTDVNNNATDITDLQSDKVDETVIDGDLETKIANGGDVIFLKYSDFDISLVNEFNLTELGIKFQYDIFETLGDSENWIMNGDTTDPDQIQRKKDITPLQTQIDDLTTFLVLS